ncbi:MAG TPA: hypothetical protein PLO33_05450 [Kouleothrix sp.]|uniref:hypothetical protein n=1 Tax=Kouleothrix sp. TaxID=2779161 RepID=UPI002BB592E4|nr:hypothetical protein [Kouleothrix sp.]HRC75101.1 hypothetical protein [Kouleothrix sp.]
MSPALLLLFLLASASAALAHVLWGRRLLQLPIFWLAACAGCLIAYALGLRLPLALPAPAGVPVLEAVLGAWILLIVASRLRV